MTAPLSVIAGERGLSRYSRGSNRGGQGSRPILLTASGRLWLLRQIAAVHRVIAAGNEGGLGRGEEADRGGHLLGPSGTLGRRHLDGRLGDLGRRGPRPGRTPRRPRG